MFLEPVYIKCQEDLRITAAPVEQDQREEGLVVARDVSDEKTDAEQMTEIIKEVREEPKEAVTDTPIATKSKKSITSQAKRRAERRSNPYPEGCGSKGRRAKRRAKR